MSTYEATITNPKKQLEFYKDLSKQLQCENKQLKDNWNELKEHIKSEWTCFDNESVEFDVSQDILNKMQELQGSDNNE